MCGEGQQKGIYWVSLNEITGYGMVLIRILRAQGQQTGSEAANGSKPIHIRRSCDSLQTSAMPKLQSHAVSNQPTAPEF